MNRCNYKLFPLKTTFFSTLLLLFLASSTTFALKPPSGTITFPNGKKITVILAKSIAEQTNGLSNIKKSEFSKDYGMLFVYKEWGPRQFWMPNTYFNLDIFFLSNKLDIIHIEKNMSAHPGIKKNPPIKSTKLIRAFHVLETRSDAHLTKKLKIGERLKWDGKLFFSQKELNTHH